MNKRNVIITVSLVVLALLGLGLWKKLTPSQTKVQLEEIKPEVGTIMSTVSTTGTVAPQNRLEIKPPIGGRMEKILVKEGDRVNKGQILALMSSTERAALLDAARLQAPKELSYWEEAYKATPIIAPITGNVIVRNIEPGQTVTSNDVLFVLSDRLMVKADVDETDIGSVKVGQQATIELDAYPDVRAEGVVNHISYESTVVNNVTTYQVEIIPDQVPAVFRSGMSANIEIIKARKEQAVIIPARALKQKNDRSFVLVKTNGDRPFERRWVQTGITNLTDVEITQGLSPDDVVVIPGDNFVQTKSGSSNGRQGRNPFMPNMRRGRGKRH